MFLLVFCSTLCHTSPFCVLLDDYWQAPCSRTRPGPKTNGVYTWWPLFVISGLAQASYTVQRIGAQTNQKTKTTKKPNKDKKQKNKDLATSLLSAIFGQSFFFFFFVFWFLCFFVFGFWFVWFLCFLFGKFRKFSEMVDFFTNFRTLSIVSGLLSETELFAAPIRRASLKLM